MQILEVHIPTRNLFSPMIRNVLLTKILDILFEFRVPRLNCTNVNLNATITD